MLERIQENLKISKDNVDEWGIQLWTSLLNAYTEGYKEGEKVGAQREKEGTINL